MRRSKVEKQIACGAIVPGCSWKAGASTEQELLQKVAQHAKDSHGVQDVTPELAAKVKAAIQDR